MTDERRMYTMNAEELLNIGVYIKVSWRNQRLSLYTPDRDLDEKNNGLAMRIHLY